MRIEQFSDDTIRADAREQLTWDTHVEADRIDVQVDQGTVRLIGSVDSEEARKAAEGAVWGIQGVHEVQNQLTVEKQDPLP